VRQAYKYRCGYCGVQEEEVGSELELDHFQPRSADGGDDRSNLVYCCSKCNRLKGDFWPQDKAVSFSRRLLHPQKDDLATHYYERTDGHLEASTETGTFHLSRLRLNRPPLLALRRARQKVGQLHQEVALAQEQREKLQERIMLLEGELEKVLEQLSRLLGH
jgi:hypothetical protein